MPVSEFLDAGRNIHDVPWAVGVYRFRISPSHETRGGEVIYVGRAATEHSSALCRRIGLFVASAMGFWVQHSGGNTFYEERDTHGLNVRDLECSWKVDPDAWCAEAEEYMKHDPRPDLNRNRPRTVDGHADP
jgi:hypothetical protein